MEYHTEWFIKPRQYICFLERRNVFPLGIRQKNCNNLSDPADQSSDGLSGFSLLGVVRWKNIWMQSSLSACYLSRNMWLFLPPHRNPSHKNSSWNKLTMDGWMFSQETKSTLCVCIIQSIHILSFFFFFLSGWPFSNMVCKMSGLVQGMSVAASIFTLVAIAVDRFVLAWQFLLLVDIKIIKGWKQKQNGSHDHNNYTLLISHISNH